MKIKNKLQFLVASSALALFAATAQAQMIIAQDDFTGATSLSGTEFTTNQKAGPPSAWATNNWSKGTNVDINTTFIPGNTVIVLRNVDTSITRTLELSTFNNTLIKISFSYGFRDTEGGELLNLQFNSGNGTFATLQTIVIPPGTQSGLTPSEFTFRFTEVGSGLQAIRFASDINDNPDRILVDNVVITAVPEPSTYAVMFGAGAVLLILVRRRRAA